MPTTETVSTRSCIALRHGPYRIGDPQRHLTARGIEMAIACGRDIRRAIGDRPATILTACSYCAIETGQQIGTLLETTTEEVVWLYDAPKPRAFDHDVRAAMRRLPEDGVLILVTHQGQLKKITQSKIDVDYCQRVTFSGYL